MYLIFTVKIFSGNNASICFWRFHFEVDAIDAAQLDLDIMSKSCTRCLVHSYIHGVVCSTFHSRKKGGPTLGTRRDIVGLFNGGLRECDALLPGGGGADASAGPGEDRDAV